ncbi:MAG: helix-turn-helix transcriptional regulator [Chloroflexi bacterium]|nr:helix-turn-helix transcriptional regulator [Chloroflexota bacterium]
MSVQIIKEGGVPAYAVMPYDEYLHLLGKIEDAEDIQEANEIRARIERGEEEMIPASLMRALVNGERPLRLWREYRGLTLQTLADRVGISKSYLSQIETGDRDGSIDVMKRLAAALDVSLDDII